ncbi:MAG TPA: O-antigen ligase family protein [Allosphingosinicella sp.]|jgi:O-antigen ligase
MSRIVASAVLGAYLLLCLLLGGGSGAGLWGNVLLQLLAVAMIFAALVIRPVQPPTRSGRRLLLLLGLMIGTVLIQLVPLPPAIWTLLPGREPVAAGFALLGQPLPWLGISLAPHDTIASALWLLPAVAVLLWVLRHPVSATAMAWIFIAVVTLSVLVGAMQIAGGEDSPWYFYDVTNFGVTVGFFANANHLATFLLATVPFLGALYMTLRGSGRSRQKTASLAVMLGGFYGVVLVGLGINGSLAGLGLMIPVTGATLLMLLRNRKVPLWPVALVLLFTFVSVGAVFSGRFDNNLISDEAQNSAFSRYTTFTLSLDAAKDHLPFGSGLGTFQAIYRTYEDPDQVTATYINHVHSDWIEIFLETGLPGLGLALLFLAWWGRRTLAIWQAAEPDYFGRAASVAIAAIMAHSLVDYPLRTVAISTIFAASCALMARSGVGPARESRRAAKSPARHLEAD